MEYVILSSSSLDNSMMKEDEVLAKLADNWSVPDDAIDEFVVRRAANIIQTNKAYYYFLLKEHLIGMYYLSNE